jgi:hypothetical protein
MDKATAERESIISKNKQIKKALEDVRSSSDPLSDTLQNLYIQAFKDGQAHEKNVMKDGLQLAVDHIVDIPEEDGAVGDKIEAEVRLLVFLLAVGIHPIDFLKGYHDGYNLEKDNKGIT